MRSPPSIPAAAQQHFVFPRPPAAEPYGSQRPYQAGPSVTRAERLKDPAADEAASPPPGELKSSRSLGDMISELQKEARMLAEAKRKSANTPPPSGGVSRSRPVSGGPPGMENWSPWPELEPKPEPQPDPLEGLEPQEAETCRQLHEMGFPLARLFAGK